MKDWIVCIENFRELFKQKLFLIAFTEICLIDSSKVKFQQITTS